MLQNKAQQTETERLEITALQTDFDAIVTELNPYGIYSQEQWDANSDYWITVNIPAIPNENSQTENIAATASCGCSQTLWFVAGYTYWLWRFWPTSAYGDWESLRNVGDNPTSTALVEDVQDRIQPFTTFTLSKPGVAEATLNMYGETDDGSFFWPSVTKHVTYYECQPILCNCNRIHCE